MSSLGVIFGVALVVVVTIVAFGLARQAAHGVAHFRDEHHERFMRTEDQ